MFTAHYFRYAEPHSEDFDTLEGALAWLANGEDRGELTSDKIVGPSGDTVMSGELLSKSVWALL